LNNARGFFLHCVSILILFVTASASAQAPAGKVPLIVGVWKLNPEKSKMTVPPDYVEIRQYAMRPDGFMVGLLIQGNAARGYHFLQFTAKSDGKEYPEYSDPIVADMIAAGKQTPRTYSETIVDEYVIDWVDRVDGKITAKGKKIISQDGKMMTITVDGSNAPPRIYDRQ